MSTSLTTVGGLRVKESFAKGTTVVTIGSYLINVRQINAKNRSSINPFFSITLDVTSSS